MKEYKYTIEGNKYNVAINEVCDTVAKVTVNGTEYTVEWEKPVEEKPVVKLLYGHKYTKSTLGRSHFTNNAAVLMP